MFPQSSPNRERWPLPANPGARRGAGRQGWQAVPWDSGEPRPGATRLTHGDASAAEGSLWAPLQLGPPPGYNLQWPTAAPVATPKTDSLADATWGYVWRVLGGRTPTPRSSTLRGSPNSMQPNTSGSPSPPTSHSATPRPPSARLVTPRGEEHGERASAPDTSALRPPSPLALAPLDRPRPAEHNAHARTDDWQRAKAAAYAVETTLAACQQCGMKLNTHEEMERHQCTPQRRPQFLCYGGCGRRFQTAAKREDHWYEWPACEGVHTSVLLRLSTGGKQLGREPHDARGQNTTPQTGPGQPGATPGRIAQFGDGSEETLVMQRMWDAYNGAQSRGGHGEEARAGESGGHGAAKRDAPKVYRCRGGCSKSFTRRTNREVHWSKFPTCEQRHAEYVRDTDEEADYRVAMAHRARRRSVRTGP